MTTQLRTSVNAGLNSGLRQSISGGKGSFGLFKAASLDLLFAKYKTLKDRISGTDLITFSRASSGTYVGSDGLIKTSPVNLMRYSEEIDQWDKFHSASVTSNAITAPDGALTADLIDLTSGGSAQVTKSFTGASSTTYTVSFWAKSTTSTDVINFYRTGLNGGSVNINITNEWQRYTSTYTTDESSPYYRVLFLTNSGSTNQYYVWGVQVEEGTTATDYIPTGATISGAPRFDHDPATGESLGLLIEEARTNLITANASHYNSIWVNAVPSGAYNNAGIAPDGTNTAFATTAYAPAVKGQKNYAMTADLNDYTFSIFIKSTGGQGQYRTNTTGFHGGDQDTINQVAYDFATDTAGHGYSRKLYANGWVRIWKTYTNTSKNLFLVSNDASTSLDMLFWGAQLEQGSYPSSLIITPVSSSVTRSPDIATIEGTNFSSFYNQSEGTLFIEAKNYPHPVTGKALVPLAFSDNTYNNRITLAGSTGSNQFNFDVVANGSHQRAILGNFVSSGLKTIGGYKSTGSAGSLDGAAVVTSNTPNIPSVISRLDFGRSHDGGNLINGHISRLAYFPTRKADQELIDLVK